MAERVLLQPGEVAGNLAGTRLFALLDPGSLARLAPLFEATRFGPGQVVAHQGEVDVSLWVLVDGQLSYDHRDDDGHVRHLGFRGYGTVIGEHGVFLGDPRTDSVVTIRPTTLLHADGEELWLTLQADPETFDRLVLPDDIRERLEIGERAAAVEGERTVEVFRRHWIVLARSMAVPLLMLVPLVALAVVAAPAVTSTLAILVLSALVLGIPLAGAVWAYFDYLYDYLILTNRRLIHLERKPLVDASCHEAPLARIQDVEVTLPGLVARLLGYGDVTIQTAGARGTIRLTRARQPEIVRQAIFEQVRQVQAFDLHRRRTWVAGQVRDAFGLPRPDPATEELGDEEAPIVLDPPGEAIDVLGPVAGLVRPLLPKMRLQDGAVVTWRKHWWVLIRSTWLVLLAGLVLAALLAAAMASPTEEPRLIVAAFSGLELLVLAVLLWRFEDWRNDLYQLTDEHIIDIERRPLGLFATRRQAKLSQIQDIHYDVPHPLAKLLNYGHVEIETAAETGSFTFDYVYRPAGVQEEIFARMDRHRIREQQEERARRAEELKLWLTEYHRLVSNRESGSPTPQA